MIDITIDDTEVRALMAKLDNMGKYVTENDYDDMLRYAVKPLKERIAELQPKSINSSRTSYSSAQINIQKYGLLEKALGVSKQRNPGKIGEHSFFIGYEQRRGRKAYVSVFLNYGTKSHNLLKKLAFLQKAEAETLPDIRARFFEKAQQKFDSVMSPYT